MRLGDSPPFLIGPSTASSRFIPERLQARTVVALLRAWSGAMKQNMKGQRNQSINQSKTLF